MRTAAQIFGWVVVAIGVFFVLAALDTLEGGQFNNGLPSLIVGVLLMAIGALPILLARKGRNGSGRRR